MQGNQNFSTSDLMKQTMAIIKANADEARDQMKKYKAS